MAKKAGQPKKPRKGNDEVERAIYFYRVSCQDPENKPLDFPRSKMAEEIDALDWTNGERYVNVAAGLDSCCWVLSGGDSPQLRMAYVRRAGFPEVDNLGTLSPLDIPNKSGLAEAIYIQFYPDGIVGVIYNFYGPRLSQLSYYLRSRVGAQIPAVTFEPLLRHDALQRLKSMQRLTMFKLRIKKPYLETLKHEDSTLHRAFAATFEAAGGTEAEILIRCSRSADDNLATRMKITARKILEGGDQNGELRTLLVSGRREDGVLLDKVDLLSDELVTRKTILLQDKKSRALNQVSAFQAIQAAYEELKVVLQAADALELVENA